MNFDWMDVASVSAPKWAVKGGFKDLFYLIGFLLMFVATRIWWLRRGESDIDTSIQNNELKTTGIYARTRNPIYFFVVALRHWEYPNHA